MVTGICRLPDTEIENASAQVLDLIQQTERRLPQLRVLRHVPDRVEARAFLLPDGRVLSRALDLEVQEIALALVEPRSEAPYDFEWHDESGQPEDRTVVMPRVISGDVWAYVAKLVELGDVRHRGSKYTKARTRVRASEGGQESLQRLESNCSPPPTPSQLSVLSNAR